MLLNYCLKLLFYMPLIFFLYQRPLLAKEWLFSPSLSIGQIYTDNVNLSAKNKQSAFITQTSPGIRVNRNTDRIKFSLNYKLQNLFNARNAQNNLYHFLQLDSRFKLIDNSLFLEARAGNNQQNINNNINSNSNAVGSLNRTNVTSYGFSPHWTPHFNGYAVGDIRFNYDEIKTGSNAIANSTKTEEIINITSDRRFSNNLMWRIAYANREEKRNNNNSIKFQNAEAEARFKITKNLNLFALVGESNIQYQTTNNSYKNGVYYTVGAQWKPMRQFNIEAGYGINSHVTINVMPFRNFNWATTFRNRGIGSNIGNTWQTNLNYTLKHAAVNATYFEDTTSSQGVLLSQAYAAQNIYQQAHQIPDQINYNISSLSNEVYIRKLANVGFDYLTGKSTFSTKLYDERRIFQESGLKEEVTGLLASWNWQFAHTMTAYISPLWQHTSRFNSSDNRKDIAVGISRFIPIQFGTHAGVNAVFEYRYSNQDSDVIENSFDENRLTANLLIAF
ncbi:MAG: TIGR03016 family PEP-CTERM system-associated outer membrane protein [Methylococcaceae bacterium]|nr:TIGR03016 family PEP-CTERM system-associated outer membrane protein [Methylococcaceae bacterium]